MKGKLYLLHISGNIVFKFAADAKLNVGHLLQVEKMRNLGLIKGGGLENAIVCRSDASYLMHYKILMSIEPCW